MIIYSIKEIVDASNSFLKPELENIHKQNKLKKNNPLILTDEILENKETPKDSKITQKKSGPNKNQTKITVKKDNVIDELYFKFNKKIKKNTLKLIIDLKKELTNLNSDKTALEISNKKLNTQINNLTKEIVKLSEQNKNLEKDKNNLNIKIKDLDENLNNTQNKIKFFEETNVKLENEEKNNSLLKNKITKLDLQLNDANKEIKNLKSSKVELEKEILEFKYQDENNKKKIYDITEVENKNKFFQDENLRIGSELLEIKKKHEILKKEIEKYENQKSNIISKINSVNEALGDTNILTNVFENKVENKVDVLDHNKIEKKTSSNIDEQIKNIFSNKS